MTSGPARAGVHGRQASAGRKHASDLRTVVALLQKPGKRKPGERRLPALEEELRTAEPGRPSSRPSREDPNTRWVKDRHRLPFLAMLYISQTGCQWRCLPASFGPWTRVSSKFRRWSRNGTWAQDLTVLHAAARHADGRAEKRRGWSSSTPTSPAAPRTAGSPSTTEVAPYGRPKRAKRCRSRRDRPPGGHGGRARLNPREPGQRAQVGTPDPAGRHRPPRAGLGGPRRHRDRRSHPRPNHGLEVRRVGWDDKQPVSGPIRHAWRVEATHGRLGRSRSVTARNAVRARGSRA